MYDFTDYYNPPYDYDAAADRYSRAWDARAVGDYSVDIANQQRYNRLQRSETNFRNTLRGINREEQASLTDYGNFLRRRVEEEQAKPKVSYLDPVTGRNLGVNPFPQSEYTPEQLGLKKVINGAIQEPQGQVDYAPKNTKDMQILGRDRAFQQNTPSVPRWTDAYRTQENPAWSKWYSDRQQAVPGGTPQGAQVNPWEIIDGEPKEPYKEQAKIDRAMQTTNRPGWSMAAATFGPTILAQQIMNLRNSPVFEYMPEHVKERYRKYFSEQLPTDVRTGANNVWEQIMKLF